MKDVSVVMRESSVSVCLLRHLLEPFKGREKKRKKKMRRLIDSLFFLRVL